MCGDGEVYLVITCLFIMIVIESVAISNRSVDAYALTKG